jgi:hypothetical protein
MTSERIGTKYVGSLPGVSKVYSHAVGVFTDDTTYVITATDIGPFITHMGETRKLEPIKEE